MDKIRKIIATPSVDDDITNPLYTIEITVTLSTEDDYATSEKLLQKTLPFQYDFKNYLVPGDYERY